MFWSNDFQVTGALPSRNFAALSFLLIKRDYLKLPKASNMLLKSSVSIEGN